MLSSLNPYEFQWISNDLDFFLNKKLKEKRVIRNLLISKDTYRQLLSEITNKSYFNYL